MKQQCLIGVPISRSYLLLLTRDSLLHWLLRHADSTHWTALALWGLFTTVVSSVILVQKIFSLPRSNKITVT